MQRVWALHLVDVPWIQGWHLVPGPVTGIAAGWGLVCPTCLCLCLGLCTPGFWIASILCPCPFLCLFLVLDVFWFPLLLLVILV